jgi:hypothetical protein
VRAAAVAVFFFTLFLAGCGYVGPVVPPSPELPNPVTDLAVVERGDQLVITFDTPARTTDNLAIRRFSEIDLRIGPAITPFDFERWVASATQYKSPLPPPNDPDDPQPRRISQTVPVSEWLGKRVDVLVRTAVKKSDHYSQWSNRVVLQVVPPIQPPTVEAKATKQGYMLSWPAQGPGFQYEIFRQGSAEHTPVQIGTAEAPLYVDSTSQWDTRYSYTVVARKDSAESLPSKPVSVISSDVFPPEIPASITALAGPESIEVSWSRSPDADLKGYYVYRSVDGGPFERQGDLISLPTFSDRNVQHGNTYRYAISAADQKGNESGKSSVAEVSF